MTEEEKAIERFKEIIRQTEIANECGLSTNDFSEEIKTYNEILNLIQSQQEEIELNNKVIDKRNEENLKLVEKCLKKDKIINEMAPQVYLNQQQREEMKKYINKLDNKPKDFTSFVKQYFEKKVEGKQC